VPLPRKFLNDDEDILLEARPHWVFFARPLFTAIVVVAGIVAILVAFSSLPNWLTDALMIVAALPVLWLVGRLLRWRSYVMALTSTRIVVRRGVLGRITVQIRLQRITEISIAQKLWERMIGTGRLIIAVQGEDDSVVIEFVRKPAAFQRVINGQINVVCGGGWGEPVPPELRPPFNRAAPWSEAAGESDTPPFGVPVVGNQVGNQWDTEPPYPPTAQSAAGTSSATGAGGVGGGARVGGGAGAVGPGEIRDRLIELDDLRQRRIISEDEFAAKKAELLSRI
jgi:membrane protein YdbS with pleckstrin-like domain